jgi:hypothetical protein
MRRRRAGSNRRKNRGLLAKLVSAVLVIGVLGWGVVVTYQLWQKVDTLPAAKGHDFITYQTKAPVLAVIKQSAQAATLDALTIIKVDLDQRTIAALELPINLSDGTTSIGQYLESHYYKEMQLGIESQLALPLSGYIIQPRSTAATDKVSLVDNFNLSNPPSWWSTTIGLPAWLHNASPVTTNLSQWELLQIAWLVRDLHLDHTNLTQVPSTAQQVADGQLQLLPNQIDPLIQAEFISPEARREVTSIVVKNATHVSGLAALASRFVANMGGEVVAVEPADTSQTNSSITAENETNLTQSLNQFLGIPTTTRSQTGRERADVELIIGTDALARLGK